MAQLVEAESISMSSSVASKHIMRYCTNIVLTSPSNKFYHNNVNKLQRYIYRVIGVDFFLKKANSKGARIFIQMLFMYRVSQKKKHFL